MRLGAAETSTEGCCVGQLAGYKGCEMWTVIRLKVERSQIKGSPVRSRAARPRTALGARRRTRSRWVNSVIHGAAAFPVINHRPDYTAEPLAERGAHRSSQGRARQSAPHGLWVLRNGGAW